MSLVNMPPHNPQGDGEEFQIIGRRRNDTVEAPSRGCSSRLGGKRGWREGVLGMVRVWGFV